MTQPLPLIDSFDRVHRDLRISLIDKCNLRCQYCMPAEGVAWMPKDELLTREELVRIARVTVALGIDEIRLTGGEPLLRADLVAIVADLAALRTPAGDPIELSLTTNGLGLDKQAAALADAGLRRVNISLDTLRRDRFVELTRRDRFDDTMAGIDAAIAAGLSPIKINSVLMRDFNENEACDLVRFAHERGLHPRFIEQMPLDAGGVWSRDTMVTAEEILGLLRSEFELTPDQGRGSDPAERWLVDGGPATVGVIASVTRPFCGACDRVRLTADGQLRNCLFARTESDLRGPLRAGASDAELAERIRASIGAKLAGHGIDDPSFLQPQRPMSAIGG